MHRQEPYTVRQIVAALPASDVLSKVGESSVIEAVSVDERVPHLAELIEVVLPVLVVNRDGFQVKKKKKEQSIPDTLTLRPRAG
jgi:hypothetical protein